MCIRDRDDIKKKQADIDAITQTILASKDNNSKLDEELRESIAKKEKDVYKRQDGALVDEEMEETDYLIGFELDVDKLVYAEILVNWPMSCLLYTSRCV